MIDGRMAKPIGQLALVLAAGASWGASRLVWVELSTANGLGQPRTTSVTGATWSSALVPLALLLLTAALAASVGRRWQLRTLAVVAAGASGVLGYLAISLWAVRDVAARAARLADVPLADLVRSQRHHAGGVLILVGAALALAAAVLLVRSPAATRASVDKYEAPARRREAARDRDLGAEVSERMMWDALDEGRDPTTREKGR